VEVTVRRGIADSGRRLPVALILGGHVTGATAARLVGGTPGVMVMAVSYPYDGEPRPSRIQFLTQIPAIRRAFLDTPPALRLALDHLYGLSEVDTTRIEGVGVSLGAPFVTIAAALDPRITRVWAIHGSGGWYAPLESSLRPAIRQAPLRYAAAAVAGVLINGPRLAPERWVAAIAPRPFVMVNATGDERLPRTAVDALYEAALEPREQLWMSGGHIHADAFTIERLVGIVRERIVADQQRIFHESLRDTSLVRTPGPGAGQWHQADGQGDGRRR
jgi:hypothetical protein